MAVEMRLDAQPRTERGRGPNRRLRRERRVPAVMYGAGKEPQPITFESDQLYRLLQHEGVFARVLTIQVGDEKEEAVIKDVQRHPFKPLVQHLDLLRVRADQPVTVHVPLHVEGEEQAPGVKKGGVLHMDIQDLAVTCLPKDLPEYLTVDVSKLNVGDSIHMSEIQVPKGVEVTALQQGAEHDGPVVSVQATRKTRGASDESVEDAEEAGDEEESEEE